MRTKYRQPSSQYVFGYQKFILMPEDYKATKSGKVNVKLPEVVGKGYGTFWRWKGRYRAVKGSRASKKSKTTALWYITNMMKYPDANTLVVRKTYRTLKDSCFTELKWAIHRLGVDAFWDIKESPLEMTYKPTGQKIYFRGLDDPLKVTSITVDQGVGCGLKKHMKLVQRMISICLMNLFVVQSRKVQTCSSRSPLLSTLGMNTIG